MNDPTDEFLFPPSIFHPIFLSSFPCFGSRKWWQKFRHKDALHLLRTKTQATNFCTLRHDQWYCTNLTHRRKSYRFEEEEVEVWNSIPTRRHGKWRLVKEIVIDPFDSDDELDVCKMRIKISISAQFLEEVVVTAWKN